MFSKKNGWNGLSVAIFKKADYLYYGRFSCPSMRMDGGWPFILFIV